MGSNTEKSNMQADSGQAGSELTECKQTESRQSECKLAESRRSECKLAEGRQSESQLAENKSLSLRAMEQADLPALFQIFSAVLAGGDVFPYPVGTTFEQFKKIWQPDDSFSYVAESNCHIVGAYYVKPTWPGRASHVGTATYMVSPSARGLGVGLALGRHSLEAARERGFSAMQFNLVVSTNAAAVKLWQKIGFQTVGTIPGGFDHAVLGKVDTYIMHREL